MSIKKKLDKLRLELNNYLYYKRNFPKVSFSQLGEDLIIEELFNILNISMPTYIDIGAYHPFMLSNTALFYKKGCHGINVEPNPQLFTAFIKHRKRDINLNVGIAHEKGVINYYAMISPTLNTFCEEEAKRMETEEGEKIQNITKIPVITIDILLNEHSNGEWPDLISIDIEGFEELVIKKINESNKKPKVICLETITYSTHRKGTKNVSIIHALEEEGYLLFADTYVNSIFVLKELWVN